MIRRTTIGLAGIVMAASAISPALLAQTVNLYYGPYAYGAGGEFTAVTQPNVFNANYASTALVNVTDANNVQQTGFETFCVQTGVDFTPYNWGNHTAYSYSTSLNSIGSPDNFALSQGTAYLYYEFATGKLKGYDYTDTATRIIDAGELQSAIWALQGNQSYGGFPSGTSGNPFYTDALNAVGSANLTKAADTSDNYGVEILNLTVTGSNPSIAAQNQLVYTGGGGNSVPDNGATLTLLAGSLAALALVARGSVLSKQTV